MAQTPTFRFKDFSFDAALVRLNRDKVYGWVETKYADTADQTCSFVSILDDGRTLVGQGGLALKSLDAAGNEIDKSSLIACYADGSAATLFPSVFEKENILSTEKKIEDYLSLDVKAVYQLNVVANSEELLSILKEHKVLYFQFNYRADYDPDEAFLIAQDTNVFIITGKLTNFTYSSLLLPTVLEDETEEETDDLDFNMF